mmetsp:Transcript_24091/g.26764  ORF Transcript_24091/g.26764 Transcript_24091/m.26764 type:complete len:117 (+) Transcript_24091:12-362(+)
MNQFKLSSKFLLLVLALLFISASALRMKTTVRQDEADATLDTPTTETTEVAEENTTEAAEEVVDTDDLPQYLFPNPPVEPEECGTYTDFDYYDCYYDWLLDTYGAQNPEGVVSNYS